jgi:hypothetical protein
MSTAPHAARAMYNTFFFVAKISFSFFHLRKSERILQTVLRTGFLLGQVIYFQQQQQQRWLTLQTKTRASGQCCKAVCPALIFGNFQSSCIVIINVVSF